MLPVESATLGGLLDQRATAARRPPVYEGRIAAAPDDRGRVTVTVRELTGDVVRLGPLPGAHPILDPGPPLAAIEAKRGDRCWVALDRESAGVVVQWEPA